MGRVVLDLVVPATAKNVPEIRRRVSAIMDAECRDADGAVHDAVRLTVTEACSNAVRHAYPDRAGDVSVTLRRDGAHIDLEVRDWGSGLGKPGASGGLGLGLELMKKLSDGCAFESPEGGGTRVRLRFACTPSSRPAAASQRSDTA